MDEMTKLVEQVGRHDWPPLATSADAIRHAADRRKRLRVVAGGAGVACALLALSSAVLLDPFGSGGEEDSVISAAGAGHQRVEMLGATMELPADWSVRHQDAPDSESRACLGPGEESGDCPVLLRVTRTPSNAPIAGLDVVSSLIAECRDADPKIVNPVHLTVNGRKATEYTARCTVNSPTSMAWALDNRVLALTVAHDRWAADAAEIFSTLRVPDSWPSAENDTVEPSVEPSSA